MSLKPSPIPPIPEVTACVAHAAFPQGNVVVVCRIKIPARRNNF